VNDLVIVDMGVQVSNLSSNSLHFVDDISLIVISELEFDNLLDIAS